MKKFLLATALVAMTAVTASAQDKLESIYNGKDLTGWHTKGNWQIEADGAITLKPRPGEKDWTRWGDYLWYDKKFTDFEIEFEYRPQKNSNSGFYLHVGDEGNPVPTGVEVQIYDSGSRPEGHKLNDHDSGGIIPGVAPTKNAAKPSGEWNKFLITCKGDDLTVTLNDVVVNKVKLSEGKLKDRPKSGSIGFQDHALPISFRNIKIRAL